MTASCVCKCKQYGAGYDGEGVPTSTSNVYSPHLQVPSNSSLVLQHPFLSDCSFFLPLVSWPHGRLISVLLTSLFSEEVFWNPLTIRCKPEPTARPTDWSHDRPTDRPCGSISSFCVRSWLQVDWMQSVRSLHRHNIFNIIECLLEICPDTVAILQYV